MLITYLSHNLALSESEPSSLLSCFNFIVRDFVAFIIMPHQAQLSIWKRLFLSNKDLDSSNLHQLFRSPLKKFQKMRASPF